MDAPGLRPTASEAFMPINPTPTPRPTRPDHVRFPPNPRQYGFIISSFPFFAFSPAPAIEHGKLTKSLFSSGFCRRRRFLVLTNQQREHGAQQHENQRLHQAHQQFQEIKRNGQQPAEAGH